MARAIEDAAIWDAPVAKRAAVLRKAAELYEREFGPIFAALALEAGKTLSDAVGELREAVDFLRYYAAEAEANDPRPRGAVTAISPWNFPLAIFTGQIAASLATGAAVLAKPAEQTPVIAAIAVRLLHEAGVPASALQLLPGQGGTVGRLLTSDPRIKGVIFTGSTDTARLIQRAMSENLDPGAPLIAETGGMNAMIVDSTALPEQAVRDIVASAFRSAGQRCSALRCLYVQEDIAPHLIEMIKGAMDELAVGDPWHLSTDVGPVIDTEAQAGIRAHVEAARKAGRVLHELAAPEGCFIAPAMLRVTGIAALEREIFGPVLHVATFKGADLEKVVAAINATGYGLTFGLHSRIDTRVQELSDQVHAGNLYVNRNQIGAVVGSQPFGGEGLSGTGPKAGGPLYLQRIAAPAPAAAARGLAPRGAFQLRRQAEPGGRGGPHADLREEPADQAGHGTVEERTVEPLDGDADHRHIGHVDDPGGAAIDFHQPAMARDPALGEDQRGTAGRNLLGQGLGRKRVLRVDRVHAADAAQPVQEPGPRPVRVDRHRQVVAADQREEQRAVGKADMVGDEHHRALGREMLGPLDLDAQQAPEHGPAQRPERRAREERPCRAWRRVSGRCGGCAAASAAACPRARRGRAGPSGPAA